MELDWFIPKTGLRFAFKRVKLRTRYDRTRYDRIRHDGIMYDRTKYDHQPERATLASRTTAVPFGGRN